MDTTLRDPEGLRRTLAQMLTDHGTLTELAFVVGALRGVVDAPGDDTERLAAVRQVLELHADVRQRDQHGAFATCADDCPRCPDATAASETEWSAAMQARGIHLVDVSTLSPEEQAAHTRDAEYAMMTDEHAAAADTDEDPDYEP